MRRTRRNGIKTIIKNTLADIVSLAIGAALIMLAVFAACFILGLPEMIGNLIVGA